MLVSYHNVVSSLVKAKNMLTASPTEGYAPHSHHTLKKTLNST